MRTCHFFLRPHCSQFLCLQYPVVPMSCFYLQPRFLCQQYYKCSRLHSCFQYLVAQNTNCHHSSRTPASYFLLATVRGTQKTKYKLYVNYVYANIKQYKYVWEKLSPLRRMIFRLSETKHFSCSHSFNLSNIISPCLHSLSHSLFYPLSFSSLWNQWRGQGCKVF